MKKHLVIELNIHFQMVNMKKVNLYLIKLKLYIMIQ